MQVDKDEWLIETAHVYFSFDTKQHLYSIGVWGWETAKGLEIGDSIEKLHQLYGQADRQNKDGDIFTYSMKGYKFGVYFDKSDSGVLGLTNWIIYIK